MKQILLFAVVLLMLSSFFLMGCKKDGFLKPKSTDSTVTTITTGLYNYVTTDNNGALYVLGRSTKTIYKYDIHTGKTPFYTLPQTTDHDTLVVNTMECLTSDSLGNIYTLSVNSSGTANVLKITQSGSASTVFSNIHPKNGFQIHYISSNSGNFYFSDNTGIYKIVPGGSPELLVNSFSSNFAIDKNGNVIYTTYTSLINSGQINLNQINAQGVKSIIAAGLYNTGDSSAFGADIVTDKFGNIYVYLTSSSFTLLKINTAAKITTIMAGAFGNVDGPFATAKVGITFNMVADPSGNIYFSQNDSNSDSYIRKITF